MEKKKSTKSSEYSPGENYSNTVLPGECVYSGIEISQLGGSFEMQQEPFKYFYKDKTLEVLERDFALKYPEPYRVFMEEQDRRLLEFIQLYSENHEEE